MPPTDQPISWHMPWSKEPKIWAAQMLKLTIVLARRVLDNIKTMPCKQPQGIRSYKADRVPKARSLVPGFPRSFLATKCLCDGHVALAVWKRKSEYQVIYIFLSKTELNLNLKDQVNILSDALPFKYKKTGGEKKITCYPNHKDSDIQWSENMKHTLAWECNVYFSKFNRELLFSSNNQKGRAE